MNTYILKQFAPKEKFRNKKNHFKKVQQKVNNIIIKSNKSNNWWDFWHYHSDWYGYGNLGWSYRKQYIEALLIVYNKISIASTEFTIPFQTWIYLSGNNTNQDAVYLHTPNNDSEFPFIPSNVKWNQKFHDPIFSAPEINIGKRIEENGTELFIYSKNIGIPLVF